VDEKMEGNTTKKDGYIVGINNFRGLVVVHLSVCVCVCGCLCGCAKAHAIERSICVRT